MKGCVAWKVHAFQLACSHCQLGGIRCLPHRSYGQARTPLQVNAWGKKTAQETVKVSPPRQSLPLANQAWYAQAGALVLAAVALLQIVKKLTDRGSMGTLESRGLITEGEQSIQSNDPFYNKMMKNVNTVVYEELSEEQIAAARRRRSQDRRNNEKVDLSKIKLPANHPFAVSKEISEEEEQLQMARLNVRRGMPIKETYELQARRGGPQQPQQPQTRGREKPQNRMSDGAAARQTGTQYRGGVQ